MSKPPAKPNPSSPSPKRMPVDGVEAYKFGEIRRMAGKAEAVRKQQGARPITLAPLPASWDTRD